MIGVPFIYAVYAFIVAFFMHRKDPHSYTHALSSCLRFLIGAQAALTNVVLSTIYCRNFRGVSPRRRVEAPEIGCHAQRDGSSPSFTPRSWPSAARYSRCCVGKSQ